MKVEIKEVVPVPQEVVLTMSIKQAKILCSLAGNIGAPEDKPLYIDNTFFAKQKHTSHEVRALVEDIYRALQVTRDL